MAIESTHRWIEHTSEVELEIEAQSAEGVLAEALKGLGELLAVPKGGARVRRQVSIEAPDLPALLAEWLEELVFLADTEGFVAGAIEDIEIEGSSLRATLSGAISTPRSLVKAVTYHRLELEPADGGWSGRVVLDV